MKRPSLVNQSLSSLPLQIFLLIGMIWSALFVLMAAALQIYKGIELLYPWDRYIAEFCFIFLYIGVELIKYSLGTLGNKTERVVPLVISEILNVGLIVYNLYAMIWQIYVFRADIVLNAICIAVKVVDCFLMLITIFTLLRYRTLR